MLAARLAKGWSLRDLERMLIAGGTPASFSGLSRIERGDRAPRPKLRKAIADLLGIDPLSLPVEDAKSPQ